MENFLFFNIIFSGLNLFLFAYAYSLKFFPLRWRKKVKQDSIVGFAIIFFTMFTMFAWIVYFYFRLDINL